MSRFAALVQAEVVGISTHPFDVSKIPTPIRQSLGKMPSDDAELALDVAAAYAPLRRAQVVSVSAKPQNLPTAERALAPQNFINLLYRLFADKRQNTLIVQALELAGRNRWALPPDLLIKTITMFTSHEHTQHVLDVLDARAKAVFANHPFWGKRIRTSTLAETNLDRALWEDGTSEERIAYFARLRDENPAAGLALLDPAMWKKEKADNRSQFIYALQTGLNPADEAFLEAALDDRAASVKKAAADTLGKLPNSALIRRAEELAKTHIVVTKRLLKRPLVTCTMVQSTDAVVRDQYPMTAPGKSVSFARFQEMVQRVPTYRWKDLIGLSAAEMLKAEIVCDGVKMTLKETLKYAAIRWKDAEFAEAVIAADRSSIDLLLRLLDDEKQDAILRACFTSLKPNVLMQVLPQRLSPELSLLIAKKAATQVALNETNARLYAQMLPCCCAPSVIPKVIEIFTAIEADGSIATSIREISNILQLRQALHDIANQESS